MKVSECDEVQSEAEVMREGPNTSKGRGNGHETDGET